MSGRNLLELLVPNPSHEEQNKIVGFLDKKTTQIDKLIKKIHIEENLTSIIVTHEMRTVYTVADRVLFLDDGVIKYDGPPSEMKNSKNKTILQFLAGSSSLA